MTLSEKQFNEMMDIATQIQTIAARNGISLTPRQTREMAEAKLRVAIQAKRRAA